MTSTEKVSFKIGLSGTYWGKKPQYSIAVDDQLHKESTIESASGEVEYIEFVTDLEPGNHKLQIRLLNKENSDTVESSDKSQILKDMLLHIKSVEIDGIDLQQLMSKKSCFYIDKPFEYQGVRYETIAECVDLGMNGTYVLEFSSPFYIWLLDNI